MTQLAGPGLGHAGTGIAALVAGGRPVAHDGGPGGLTRPLTEVRGLRW
jgi:hypothetical protein